MNISPGLEHFVRYTLRERAPGGLPDGQDRQERHDRGRHDVVGGRQFVIDPVDLSTDGFKQNVNLVTQAVANTDGSPDFSARVFDDEDIASEAFSEERHSRR